MTRWFRFYDESLNDPKILRLSDGLYRAWTLLLCFASKNDGILPSIDDMAATLRTKPLKVSDWVEKLLAVGLIDRVGDHYEPHNWNGRQYKSDVSNERVKQHRQRKRNVTPAVTVTPPETEQIQNTETEQKDCADAPSDPSVPEREFFARGREILGKSSGGLLAKLLASKGKNVALARSALEAASQKENPGEYVAAVCRGPPIVRANSVYQQRQAEGREILHEIDQSISRRSGAEDSLAVRHDSGNGRAAVRGGPRASLVVLPAITDRSGG